MSAVFAMRPLQYPLKASVILDSGATLHIFNDIRRFTNYQEAPPGDLVWAGDSDIAIGGYGTVKIKVNMTKKGRKGLMKLYDVAYCPNINCNLVSLKKLRSMQLWWDGRPGHDVIRNAVGYPVAYLEHHYDQYVLEYVDNTNDATSSSMYETAFLSSLTSMDENEASGNSRLWHLRLGHPGPKAVENLVKASIGVKLKAPTTVECDACSVSKLTRQIRRTPRERLEGPGLQLAIDFHDYEMGM